MNKIQNQIETILCQLSQSQQLKELEKLSMKIRKQNGVRINNEVNKTRAKYPKIK